MLFREVHLKLSLVLDTSHVKVDLKKLKVNLEKAKNIEHKWIPSQQWHIPLCSLGDVTTEDLFEIEKDLLKILPQHPAFELKLEGVWAYPSQDHGRLLWIGVQNSKELRSLQEELFRKFQKFIPEETFENAFKPYLPIVRFRNYKKVSDLLSPHKNAHFGKFPICKLIIYEMTSQGAFPTYQKVSEFMLNEEKSDHENQISC